MREKYGKRMSKTFAFLRDIPTMKCAVEEIEKDSDLDSFLTDIYFFGFLHPAGSQSAG
jgi:hypothetical protein